MKDDEAPPSKGYGEPGARQDDEPRCWRCNRMLARLLTRPWHIDCPRCSAANRR